LRFPKYRLQNYNIFFIHARKIGDFFYLMVFFAGKKIKKSARADARADLRNSEI